MDDRRQINRDSVLRARVGILDNRSGRRVERKGAIVNRNLFHNRDLRLGLVDGQNRRVSLDPDIFLGHQEVEFDVGRWKFSARLAPNKAEEPICETAFGARVAGIVADGGLFFSAGIRPDLQQIESDFPVVAELFFN